MGTTYLTYTVFISHNSKDKEWVDQIYQETKTNGINAYIYDHDPKPGEYVADEDKSCPSCGVSFLHNTGVEESQVHEEPSTVNVAKPEAEEEEEEEEELQDDEEIDVVEPTTKENPSPPMIAGTTESIDDAGDEVECPECGSVISADTISCYNCGVELEDDDEDEQNSPSPHPKSPDVLDEMDSSVTPGHEEEYSDSGNPDDDEDQLEKSQEDSDKETTSKSGKKKDKSRKKKDKSRKKKDKSGKKKDKGIDKSSDNGETMDKVRTVSKTSIVKPMKIQRIVTYRKPE